MGHITYLETDKETGMERALHFWCPGCNSPHAILLSGRGVWEWNRDRDKPTFSPSVLSNAGKLNPEMPVCHSYVEAGNIRFLTDCTHELAGQTVPLPEW